jgi:adenine-specific DNA-methyltransferase
MYEFNWEGKELAYKLAQTPSTGTLIPDKEGSKNWDNTENLYIEGDNLEVLKLLLKSYFDKLDLIFIDPPYNTGTDIIYKNNFADPIKYYKFITGQVSDDGKSIKTNTESNGRYHTDWVNMMYSRLKISRNLLKREGIFCISIDHNEVFNLGKICDEVFGEDNRIAIISVVHKPEGRNQAKFIGPSNEYLFVYAKNISYVKLQRVVLDEELAKQFEFEDDNGSYKLKNFIRLSDGKYSLRQSKPAFWYPIYVSNDLKNLSLDYFEGSSAVYPITIQGIERTWKTTKDTFIERYNKGNIIAKRENDNIIIYEKLRQDEVIKTHWVNKKYHGFHFGTKVLDDLLKVKTFDFPKSLYLMKDIIKLFCNKNGLILDFFSGSATTCHAAMELNVEDNGNRKFIAVQLPEKIDEKSEAYKAGYKNICEIGKERIRRAGNKIVSENKDKEGIENLDIGFKVFKLVYNKGDNKMYNAKLIELSNKTNIMYRGHQIYELKDVYFYVLQTEEEYIQWRYKNDIFWNMEHSEEFYNRLMNPMKIEILTNKKPKELKGKKKIATINKDADYKVQVFIDDDYNLYYQDNHAFASCESKIVDNKVETAWNSCKCWFKIIGLYECRNNHIVDILRDLNSYSEYLYPKNNVADNVMLSRLYEQMVNVYLDYVNN